VNCWGGVDDVNCYWLVFLGLKSMFLVFGAEGMSLFGWKGVGVICR
jgi:hypothetical protein